MARLFALFHVQTGLLRQLVIAPLSTHDLSRVQEVHPALAAYAQAEREADGLQRQWQLRVERARYEVEQAQRQYQLGEPENRLVARSLEQQWEEKLRALDAVADAYRRWRTQQQKTITNSNREEILRLGEDLPHVWHAPTTTNADHKGL